MCQFTLFTVFDDCALTKRDISGKIWINMGHIFMPEEQCLYPGDICLVLDKISINMTQHMFQKNRANRTYCYSIFVNGVIAHILDMYIEDNKTGVEHLTCMRVFA